MKRESTALMLLVLAGCGSVQSERERQGGQPSVELSPQYSAAVRCWALADIVEALVESDVTSKPAFKAFAQTEHEWRGRAVAIGAKYGRLEPQVIDDFQVDQMKLLAPVQERPQEEAAIYVQTMVSGAGECRISSTGGGR